MVAYLLATFRVHDPSWLDEYRAKVPAIIRKHGGEYVAVSETIKRLEGDGSDPDTIVLLIFPSMDVVDAFVSDVDYRPYKAARLAATSGDMVAFTPRS